MRKSTIGLVPLLTVAVLIGGCGGGDDTSSDTTSTALSKSEYLKQGNAICEQGDQQINAAVQKTFDNKKPTQQQLTDFATDTAIPIIEDEISQLRALEPPSGDEATVNAIYDAADQGVADLKENPARIAETAGGGAFEEANKLANDYGLTACAD